MRPHPHIRRESQRGLIMPMALFALATLTVALSSALVVGVSGLHATRNYRGATQVHFVAESAIAQALQVVNGPGIVHLRNDVVTPWASIWGSMPRTFTPLPRFSYTVIAQADAGDPANLGRLVATATGGEGFRNVVVANVVRSDVPSTSPGAMYLAQDGPTNATFNGNSFHVDGNDRNYTGGAGPNPPIAGISARNDGNVQETINSLSNNQRHNVTGLGYSSGPPVVPSVKTSPAAPSVAQLNQFVDDLLARPGVVTVSDSQLNNSTSLPGWCKGGGAGCQPTPEITYFNAAGAEVTIKGNGNLSGAGILIVEGDLTIQGTLDFKGLIIVRGRTSIQGETEVTGNAHLWGALWTNDINFVVAGNAFIQYSTQALGLANQASGGAALPAPLRVVSMADCAEMPAGVGGCPS